MKNIIIGFVLGYLGCAYVLVGPQGVADTVTHSLMTLQGWFEYTILYIQNYTPKA